MSLKCFNKEFFYEVLLLFHFILADILQLTKTACLTRKIKSENHVLKK